MTATMTATMTGSSTQTPSMTATSTQTPTASATPCFSASFRAFARMDLIGSLHSSVHFPSAPSAPVPVQRACELACCHEPLCRGFTVTGFAPEPGFDNCFLYANVSELMPNVAVASWVARSAL